MLRLRMVAMVSGLLLTAGIAGAQVTPAPQPTAPATADDPTATPYQADDTQSNTDAPAATDTTPQQQPAPNTNIVQPPAPNTTVVQQPAPVIVQQPAPEPEPAVTPPPVVVEEHPVNVTVVESKPRRNLSLSLGGGISDFTDGTVRDRTDINAAYEARLGIGIHSILGLEAAYVGTAGSIDTLGLDDDAMLISNGVEGLARLNLGNFEVQPYVVGGASWVRYSVVNDSFNSSDVRDSDDVLAIPFGGGVSSYLGDSGLMLDARFTYRATFDDDLIRPTPSNSDGSSLSNWMATLKLGYTF